uniref:Uncharacterized protein n=1 Tax=Myotis myotis TaxID=51298 RepID=A0A7J7R3X7_MYOMY|nr:hypothetical protein mMyoMyo1_010923 [Myotis myotis]
MPRRWVGCGAVCCPSGVFAPTVRTWREGIEKPETEECLLCFFFLLFFPEAPAAPEPSQKERGLPSPCAGPLPELAQGSRSKASLPLLPDGGGGLGRDVSLPRSAFPGTQGGGCRERLRPEKGFCAENWHPVFTRLSPGA